MTFANGARGVGGLLICLIAWAGMLHAQTLEVQSPGGQLKVQFQLKEGVPYYRATFGQSPVILPSRLGFRLKGAPPLKDHFKIAKKQRTSKDETWTQPWGEEKQIRNHYNELRILLEETGNLHRRMAVVFRAYDDGFGFRYEWPEQPNLKHFEIMDELTEFVLSGDHTAWWIPAFQRNRYEYLYRKTRISQIASDSIRAVHTPVTLETTDGLYLSFHEADLTDYSSMALAPVGDHTFTCELFPWWDGVKVRADTPHRSPWRTIQIARDPGGLITSHLILNLNEPNKLGDVSWVHPFKYVGIWWGMHIGKYTWASGEKHGATTENTKRYIDFAAKYGFYGVLVEGWNVGWDGNWIENSDSFRFTQPYPDYDIEELSRYAASKGVKLIGHHETSAGIENYERQMDDAFAFLKKYGIEAVKTGYVGHGRGIKWHDAQGNVHYEWHHGQFMVRHYRKVVKKAAQYRVMLDVHEPIKDTGIRRTYPNMMTREGARGQEYNAWSAGNPPEHTTILPFTRLLAGPMDFTPGIFDLYFDQYRPQFRVHTTLAKQLALYVVLYSPWQMAADLPENYEANPRPFKFIVDVPVDWEFTRVLHARIGDYVTIVRKDRNSDDWYLGSITDENGRTLKAKLDFLEPGRKYVAEIYADGPDADYQTNPLAIDIRERLVDSNTTYTIRLAPGGGQAIRFRPATAAEERVIAPYREPTTP
ncbi:MAG: glycoside hydrolase family 97 protein [Calditrichaeota bacterium]|nr:MAG: glycoside hydrolase family 97 protein [Calditrichota bacterium]